MQHHLQRSKLVFPMLVLPALAGLAGCKGPTSAESASVAEPRTAGSSRQSLAEAMTGLAMIRMALDEFAANNGGQYPLTLEVLVQPDMNGARYVEMQRLPRDPWDREYVYTRDPLRLLSYGRDGAPGGTGDDADIENVFVVGR